jgi:hypothetical protein
MPSGIKATYELGHKDINDNLIVAEKTRRFHFLETYDEWRVAYCLKHRDKKLWLSFREGKVNPFTLIYALILKLRGG